MVDEGTIRFRQLASSRQDCRERTDASNQRTFKKHGSHPVERNEARDGGEEMVVEERFSLSTELCTTARTSGLGAEAIQDLHIREWMFLARAPCQFTI